VLSILHYSYHHLARLPNPFIAKQNLSQLFHVISNGSPSRILSVRRISLGITTLPSSSIRRTIPVALIDFPCLLVGTPPGSCPAVPFVFARVVWDFKGGLCQGKIWEENDSRRVKQYGMERMVFRCACALTAPLNKRIRTEAFL